MRASFIKSVALWGALMLLSGAKTMAQESRADSLSHDFKKQAKEIGVSCVSADTTRMVVFAGQEVENPSDEQRFLHEALELCRWSKIGQEDWNFIKEYSVPVAVDKSLRGVSGSFTPMGENGETGIIRIKKADGDYTTPPDYRDVNTLLEEMTHCYDYMKHDVKFLKDDIVFSPFSKVVMVLNLEASAKARKFAALHEIGYDIWEQSLEAKEQSISYYAQTYQKAMDQGRSQEEAIALLYHKYRSEFYNGFQSAYIHHALDWDGDDVFDLASIVYSYQGKECPPENYKEVNHDMLLRAGHIPGSDVNFLEGFEDLMSPAYLAVHSSNYKKIALALSALKVEEEHVHFPQFSAYMPLSFQKEVMERAFDDYEEKMVNYDDLRLTSGEKIDSLRKVIHEYALYQADYEKMKAGEAVERDIPYGPEELENLFMQAFNEINFYRAIDSGWAQRKMTNRFPEGIIDEWSKTYDRDYAFELWQEQRRFSRQYPDSTEMHIITLDR